MKIGPDSALYVLQWSGNGRVKRFDLAGNFLSDFTSRAVTQSIGLDWDTAGNLYVSSYNGDHIRKFDTAGLDLGLFISTNLVGPTNIWFLANGEIMVSDYDVGAIKRFSSSGTFLGVFTSGLSQSEGYEYLPNGHLLIGNGRTASVREFDSSGTFIKNFIPTRSGGLVRPNALRLRYNTSTGMQEEKNELKIDHSIIDQELIVEHTGKYVLKAFDLSGRAFLEKTCLDQCRADLQKLNSGIYLITIQDEYQKSMASKIFYQALD